MYIVYHFDRTALRIRFGEPTAGLTRFYERNTAGQPELVRLIFENAPEVNMVDFYPFLGKVNLLKSEGRKWLEIIEGNLEQGILGIELCILIAYHPDEPITALRDMQGLKDC